MAPVEVRPEQRELARRRQREQQQVQAMVPEQEAQRPLVPVAARPQLAPVSEAQQESEPHEKEERESATREQGPTQMLMHRFQAWEWHQQREPCTLEQQAQQRVAATEVAKVPEERHQKTLAPQYGSDCDPEVQIALPVAPSPHPQQAARQPQLEPLEQMEVREQMLRPEELTLRARQQQRLEQLAMQAQADTPWSQHHQSGPSCALERQVTELPELQQLWAPAEEAAV